MKKILVTGVNGYIGTNLISWLVHSKGNYLLETISLKNNNWMKKDFSKYDVIIHLAAIVHKKEKKRNKALYFKINSDLTLQIAIKAKLSGVKQFIFMSTMAVYGENGKIGENIVISNQTVPNPKTYYAKSKMEAENKIRQLNNEKFKVVIIRPPIIYGPNCPGNYRKLEKLATKIPVFPMIENKRSMLHIDKLCHYIQEYIDKEVEGLFLPQDKEYVNTSMLVKELANKNGKKIYLSRLMGNVVKLIGTRISLFNKIFGNLIYSK